MCLLGRVGVPFTGFMKSGGNPLRASSPLSSLTNLSLVCQSPSTLKNTGSMGPHSNPPELKSVIVSTFLLHRNLQYLKCKERKTNDYFKKSVLFLPYTNIKGYMNSGQSDLQPYHPCGSPGSEPPSP